MFEIIAKHSGQTVEIVKAQSVASALESFFTRNKVGKKFRKFFDARNFYRGFK